MIVHKYIQSNVHALSVVVVGAGGTGSVLLQHLARIHMSLRAQGKKGLMVSCIDGDKVEAHNPGRQLYTPGDVGRYKCVVMIERINRFYGTPWEAIPAMFNRSIHNENNILPGNILISCTDNVQARKDIDAYLREMFILRVQEQYDNHYWIDTGNGRYTGQVILGSVRHSLPTCVELFPDMAKREKKSKNVSCSLAEALEGQDLFVNPMVAMVASQLVWNITQEAKLDWTAAFINLKNQSPVKYKHYEHKGVQ